jgi:hypothetical protein
MNNSLTLGRCLAMFATLSAMVVAATLAGIVVSSILLMPFG